MAFDNLNSVMFQQHMQHQSVAAAQSLKNRESVADTHPSLRSSQPGTMYVNDFFTPTSPSEIRNAAENPHGIQVARAARQQSFQGRIEGASQHASVNDTATAASMGRLRQQPLNQRDARLAVQQFTSSTAAGLLDSQARYLDGLTQRGARNSAANISLGSSKASTTRTLYNEASLAWNPNAAMPAQMRQEANQTLRNLSTAYGLDTTRLLSTDPRVHRPERQKLQQRLLDHVSQTTDRDPTIARERREWGSSVSRFEAGRNSVVIAAGNEGSHIERLEQSNGGRPLRAPADASTNILENSQVTSVGATRWTNAPGQGPREQRANYSSDSQGVDIYAAGSLDANGGSRADIHGTSFAAPRVASTIAELHRRNPRASSAQIEAMMKEQLTHGLSSGAQNLRVLDFQRTSDFLAHSPTRR